MATILWLPATLRHVTITPSLFTPIRRCHRPLRFSTSMATKTSSEGRSYADALTLLDSLQSNRATVSSISDASRDLNLDAIPEMLDWTRKAGYDMDDFTKHGLRCVQVAGTKGKGSVCVMVENMLLQFRPKGAGDGGMMGGRVLGKIGMFTSPHLMTVRERIRLDGEPIPESLFTRYFFELWDRLSDAASTSNPSQLNPLSPETKPSYFRYLTLLALHTFVREGVESAIIECGIGGEYDSTNIIPPEAVTVTAITPLGIDHIGMLGDTIEKIAWHKAGIMKSGIPAYTAKQALAAQAVLEIRAAVKGVDLITVDRHPSLDNEEVKLGIEGDFQKDNASLAIAVTACHLRTLGIIQAVPPIDTSRSPDKLLDQFVKGLTTVKWPGRCEVRRDGNIEWLIDGAHTAESLEETARWFHNKFVEAIASDNPPTATMLIFNQQDRDSRKLLASLMRVLMRFPLQRLKSIFTFAAFCDNTPFKSQVEKGVSLDRQEAAAKSYEKWDRNTLHMCYGSVEEAMELARRISEGDKERVLVLVTGSLYLVRGLMEVLEKEAEARRDHGDISS